MELFALNLASQVLYLSAASRWLKPESDAGALGRRRTINAALLWTCATIAVAIWAHNGLLR